MKQPCLSWAVVHQVVLPPGESFVSGPTNWGEMGWKVMWLYVSRPVYGPAQPWLHSSSKTRWVAPPRHRRVGNCQSICAPRAYLPSVESRWVEWTLCLNHNLWDFGPSYAVFSFAKRSRYLAVSGCSAWHIEDMDEALLPQHYFVRPVIKYFHGCGVVLVSTVTTWNK